MKSIEVIRNKFIKMIIISIFFIFIVAQGSVYATQLPDGGKAYFGLEALMTKTNVGYSIQAPNTDGASRIWNIIRYTNSNYNQYYDGKDANIYCLKANVGFATDEDRDKRQAEYDTYYNMKTERTNIRNHNTVLQGLVDQNLPETSINRYNTILALLDRFYLPGESTDADKQALIKKILEFARKSDSPYNAEYELMEPFQDTFTEDDINAIQQVALWYLTNSTSKGDKYDKLDNRDGSWLYYSTTGEKDSYSQLNNYRPNGQPHDEGEARCYIAKAFYDMIIQEAKENASSYANIQEQSEPPAKIEKQEALKGKVVGSNYVIGPIKITESTTNKTPYTIDFKVDKSYKLSNESGAQIQGKTVQQLVKEKQDIYISIPVSSVTDSVKVDISIKYEERTMTLWTAYQESNAVRQPLAEVTTKQQTNSEQLTFTPEKEFDLALRKYITQINDTPVSEEKTREPAIENGTIATNDTATYKHRKDPVEVKTNDFVIYNITIYNEGEAKGRATKIVDQLPAGLKFISVEEGPFTGSCDGANLLTLTRTGGNETNLDPYTGGKLSSETVKIKCQVTAEAGESDKTLTNVAWIQEEVNGLTGDTITNEPGEDRDSVPEVNPGTTKGLNQNNMDTYTGKQGNPSDLENPGNYFEGEQDDDDFEKVKVKKAEGEYTVQLEKVDSSSTDRKLNNAQFKVTMPDNSVKNVSTSGNGQIDLGKIQITQVGTEDTIIIEEVTPPEGYKKLIEKVTLKVTKQLQNGKFVATAINKETSTDNLSATVQGGVVKIVVQDEPKKFDLALRKYITKINGAPLSKEDTRTPVIEKESISSNGTATYKHRKDAKVVQVGDYITYSITIYNEGERKGRATKIVDQLPEGLKFEGVESGNFTGSCDPDTNLLTLTRTSGNNTNLDPYTGGELASETADVKCQVTADATSGDKTLTNVAWIAEEVDGVTEERITDEKGKDKDSVPGENPGKTKSLTKDNMDNYTGKGGNPSDLENPNKYFEGEQDDDDFEKVKVKKLVGSYTVKIEKEDSKNGNTKLANAQFKITMPDKSIRTLATGANGQIDLGTIQMTEAGTDTIIIEETAAPEGYEKLIGTVTLHVEKELQEGGLVAKSITEVEDSENLNATITAGAIKIVIKDEPKEFDLALRKYITKINGDPLSEDETRTPVIEKEIISSNGTAKYKHRKDAKVVQTGDFVTYSITIYNEGERKGRATKIVDQLPEGLKFIEVEKGNFTGSCDPDTNLLTLTRTSGNNTNLDPYTGGELASETVDIKCQITANATSGDKTLTNVAWIAEEVDGVSGERITSQSGKDKDSVPGVNPGTTKDLTKDNMDNYTGKDGNPPDLENPNNYFEGEQDDDDFEKVQVKKLVGAYTVTIEKEDSKNVRTKLANAQFKITMPDNSIKTLGTNASGQIDLGTIQMTEAGTDTIIIEETAAPEGYEKLIGTVTLHVEKELQEGGLVAKSITEVEDSDNLNATVAGGAVKIVIKDEPKDFDLALRKYITKVNDKPLSQEDSRIPNINKDSISTDGTATYKHKKDAVSVRTGDYITYSLTVYNEGERKGRATKIVDQLPEGLKFIGVESGNFTGSCDENTNLLTLTRIAGNETNLNPYEGGELASETIEIKCQVVASPTDSDKNLVNVAWIAEEVDGVSGEKITEEKGKDKDSTPGDNPATNPDTNVNKDNTSDYKGNPSNPDDLTDPDKYYKGQEDDDDFEKVVVPAEKLDLRLKKFITEVNNQSVPDRIKDIDVSKLNTLGEDGKLVTDAEFDMNKEPVLVKVGDIVTYTFRIYNEGMLDGYAEEITEDVPQGLEYLYADLEKGEETLTDAEKEAIEYNKTYLWGFQPEDIDENGRVTKITTNYLAKATNETDNLIKAFGQNNGNKTKDDLDYVEVSVKFKVISEDKTGKAIRNEACISKQADGNGTPVEEDRDSTPGSGPDEWKKYEDDEDYDNVILQSFDLALRKFITKVEDKPVDTRIPQLNYNSEKEQIEYTHPKDPVIVSTENTVEYTIRVFNEGKTNGYAAQILDDIPDGLQYLPENETNKQYGWKMYRQLKEGEVVAQVVGITIKQDGKTYVQTENASEAEVIVTEYLSKEQGEARIGDGPTETENPNLLKAFNKEAGITETNPDHKDVKVAFKVVEPNTSNKIIVNSAQISKDTDEDGNEVEDEDSEPGEWNDGEDDQDKEFIELKNFDLALRKWVTQAIVIDNGKQAVTQTGHKPYDDPEQVVKVEIKAGQLNKVTVKFRYSIRVTNEGDIEGYAKEVTDYVPSGLKFVAADNPGWTDEGNNVISTRLLENKLLKPGEYADIDVVLTWINSENGLGTVLENTAEISEDYNEYGVPDKDSKPDNKKTGEDDIDVAPVLLSIKTGQIKIYFTLGFIVLVTTAVGIIVIKRYVL